MLLSRGHVVYHGRSEQALDYFTSIGKYVDAAVKVAGTDDIKIFIKKTKAITFVWFYISNLDIAAHAY